MLANKFYVIRSVDLVSAVQHNSQSISLIHFSQLSANRMSGIEGEGLKLLQETENGGGGLNNKVLHSMHPALQGEGLDGMNRAMFQIYESRWTKLENV